MRNALLVVASLLAGCRDGVELEILADGTTARVEVFVASRAAAPDSALAAITALGPANPDPDAPLVAGTVYPRDLAPDGSIEPAFEAQVGSDRRARLALEAEGDQTYIHALIAVGFDAEGTITSAAVQTDIDLAGAPLRLIMELVPVTRTLLDGQPAAAQVWGREETGGAGCVGVTTKDGDTRFIVTEADPDCDGYTHGPTAEPPAGAVECDAVDYHGDVDSAATSLQSIDGTCRPAEEACVDGPGPVAKARDLCLPDRVCELPCATSGLDACLGTSNSPGAIDDPIAFAHVTCALPSFYDPTSGTHRICDEGAVGTSDLSTLFTGAVACTDVAFAPLEQPGSFDQDLTLSAAVGGGEAVTARAEIVANGTSACAFTLTPNVWSFATTPILQRQLVRLRADNGQELLLPLKLVTSECSLFQEGIKCKYERSVNTPLGADGIEACAQQP